MKISGVQAILLRVPVTIPFVGRQTHQGVVLVLVQTDEGLTGLGVTRDDNAIPTREIINQELAPFLTGRNPLQIELIWNEAWAERRGAQMRMGVEGRAISAIDQALWDIKGKACNQPVFRLLGGASGDSVPIYTTFGLNVLRVEELVGLAKQLVAEGHDKFKLQVVAADGGQDVEEDVTRIRMVREAVGPKVKLVLNAGGVYNYVNIVRLAKRLEPYDITFIGQLSGVTDVRALAQLRQKTTVPIGASAETVEAYRDLIAGGAVDVVQPNVVFDGGYTQCQKVAHMAELYHLPVATVGAWHLQNAQLIAGVKNGWMTEYMLLRSQTLEAIFMDTPRPQKGVLPMPDLPGLGLTLNEAAVKEYTETVAHQRTDYHTVRASQWI